MLSQDTEGAREGWHIDLAHHGGIVECLVGGSEGQLHLVGVAAGLDHAGATDGQQTGSLGERHYAL